jgi:hypothetical protein
MDTDWLELYLATYIIDLPVVDWVDDLWGRIHRRLPSKLYYPQLWEDTNDD